MFYELFTITGSSIDTDISSITTCSFNIIITIILCYLKLNTWEGITCNQKGSLTVKTFRTRNILWWHKLVFCGICRWRFLKLVFFLKQRRFSIDSSTFSLSQNDSIIFYLFLFKIIIRMSNSPGQNIRAGVHTVVEYDTFENSMSIPPSSCSMNLSCSSMVPEVVIQS